MIELDQDWRMLRQVGFVKNVRVQSRVLRRARYKIDPDDEMRLVLSIVSPSFSELELALSLQVAHKNILCRFCKRHYRDRRDSKVPMAMCRLSWSACLLEENNDILKSGKFPTPGFAKTTKPFQS